MRLLAWLLLFLDGASAFLLLPNCCLPCDRLGGCSVGGCYAKSRKDKEDPLLDDDDEEDDEPPDVDISNFNPTVTVLNSKGRSAPTVRAAIGKSGPAVVHVCTECGSEYLQWMGKCNVCGAWNSLQEHVVSRQSTAENRPQPTFGAAVRSSGGGWILKNNDDQGDQLTRVTDLLATPTHHEQLVVPNDEDFNLVMGGGIMQGSLTLLGGDPGVGKSTLLLQTAGSVASQSRATPKIGMGLPSDYYNNTQGPVWYVSGEENAAQIASRAERLGIAERELYLLSETHVDTLCARVAALLSVETPNHEIEDEDGVPIPHHKPLLPALLVIDSIQTLVCEAGGTSAAGGVTQVRECVSLLLKLAKSTSVPVLLIGHVTKSGDVAGPRTVEHMVDCVLYLEGRPNSALRTLRASKNRFGSSEECGVYEMTKGRLVPVSDPSAFFLENRNSMHDVEGCAVALVEEGMRAFAVEIQSLVATAAGSKYGRKTVYGVSGSRLALLLGVLQQRVGIYLGANTDVYVNLVGQVLSTSGSFNNGDFTATDLAVATALTSSLQSIPVRADTAFCAEVGLLGELRPSGNMKKRLEEARRLGFSRVVGVRLQSCSVPQHIDYIQCDTLLEALNTGLVRKLPRRRARVSRSSDRSPCKMEDLGLEITDDTGQTVAEGSH